MKLCPKCGTEHRKQGKFCSRSCANSRECTAEKKAKLSSSLKGRIGTPSPMKGKHRVSSISKECPNCKSLFTSLITDSKVYCSNNCWKQNSGGYREGSGRAKTGYYKGIYCGSTYELCWVIYQLDHGNKFERFKGSLEFNGKRYFPDFIQNDIIVEIKGYESQDSVDIKTKIANKNGYEVVVLRKEQLKECFDWVSANYSKNYKTLYDEYRPKYDYICECCNKEFSRDKQRKAKFIVCSRSCSLKMNRKNPVRKKSFGESGSNPDGSTKNMVL